jgi:hypothetical protein
VCKTVSGTVPQTKVFPSAFLACATTPPSTELGKNSENQFALEELIGRLLSLNIEKIKWDNMKKRKRMQVHFRT